MAIRRHLYVVCLFVLLHDVQSVRTALLDSDSLDDATTLSVLEWDDDLKSIVDAAIKSKKEMASSELETGGSGNWTKDSKYSYVQQVGLSLYTFPSGTAKYGVKEFYDGIDNSVQTHEGTLVNNQDDARARVRLLQYMINVAYKSKEYSRDSSVLKVFMAPEFFFRGPYGAYNMNSLHGCTNRNSRATGICNAPIIAILTELSHFILHERFADWIFVMGTVVSYTPPARRIGGRREYFNFAPIMRGGKAGHMQHHIVAKSYVSGIDFLDCDGRDGKICVGNPKSMGISRYAVFTAEQQVQLNQLGFNLRHDNHFYQDGIHFGLEVCLDHAQKQLAQGLRGGSVQVHLVTSAGMKITWSAAGSQGPVLLQDGGAQGARTEYYCPGCDYLGRGLTEAAGFTPNAVVDSSDGQTYDQIVRRYGRGSNTPSGAITTPRDIERFFSHRGYATEGDSLGTDLRFNVDYLRGLYAIDDYRPQINIGPAFKIPGAHSAPQPHGGHSTGGCADHPSIANWLIDGKPATCQQLAHYCKTPGAEWDTLREGCKRTCGLC
eukprot:TRINITY_DN79078_c0_g1_i1.p1 TRINITY_DN79078_c0_g1~~TRINITY_DN79078_c0_g1_i1.p1  ORF type:complete len:548 (+),score=62.71 TRINITY_DN79078_c0_g1_i1:231-1874(+)